MKRAGLAATLVAGLTFGAGLIVSGMTRPRKVIGFLDVFGNWDASLAFVMLGAIGVHLVVYRLVRKRPSPLFSKEWGIPSRRDIDLRLVLGAALFGAGWGIAGYCPGPSLVSVASAAPQILVFVTAMLLGVVLVQRLEAVARRPKPSEHVAESKPAWSPGRLG
jgi:uncharacterized membrane protein YedE/YeeE